MKNLWLELANKPKCHTYPALAPGVMLHRKFRWLATLYGPDFYYEGFCKVSTRFDVDERFFDTLTFLGCEKFLQHFDFVVLTLVDGCGCPLERYVLLTKIKKMQVLRDEEEMDFAFDIDAKLLKYENFCETVTMDAALAPFDFGAPN